MSSAVNSVRPLMNIEDVWQALEHLNQLLDTSDLRYLQNFNKAYAIITKNVLHNLKADYFDDPAFLETFDVRFVQYYFDALSNYLSGDSVPAAWRALFEGCRQQQLSPLKAMALGVNAHVNNDIAQVLLDCRALRHHKRDFNRINGIIDRSLEEVFQSLHSHRGLLDPRRRGLGPLYKLSMRLVIRLWRAAAWYSFIRLQKSQYDVGRLEHRAALVSLGTRKLPI